LWITQDSEFLQTLEAIHGVQVAVFRWMAAQLRAPRWQRLHDVNQSFDADHVGQGSTFGGLSIEAAAIANFRRALSERNPKPLSHLDENGTDWFPQMDVLVGIEMTGITTHEVMEYIQLVGYFTANGGGILHWHHRI
jgi:hypothetical protein